MNEWIAGWLKKELEILNNGEVASSQEGSLWIEIKKSQERQGGVGGTFIEQGLRENKQ